MTHSKINWNNWNWNALTRHISLKGCKTTKYITILFQYPRHKGLKLDSFHQKSTLLSVKKVQYPTRLILYLILCALEGLSKKSHQHITWKGLSGQMAHLIAKNGGIIANNCPFEPAFVPSPSLQVLLRGVCTCNLEEDKNKRHEGKPLWRMRIYSKKWKNMEYYSNKAVCLEYVWMVSHLSVSLHPKVLLNLTHNQKSMINDSFATHIYPLPHGCDFDGFCSVV